MPASKKKAPVVAEGAELPPSVFAELERRVNQVNHHRPSISTFDIIITSATSCEASRCSASGCLIIKISDL
jgi:hypothetical protein